MSTDDGQPAAATATATVTRLAKARLDGARFGLARALRVLLVPLAIAAPPLFWIVTATERASRTPLGRDQGIFQYVAWALRQGLVDYRDVRDVNGPLTHLVHVAFLALGGADDHRFRTLDLLVTGATFAFAGACLPGLRSRAAPSALERAAWALAGWVVLSGQYLLFGYWDLAQRESFFDWFMLPGVTLQLVAQAPWIGRVDAKASPVDAAAAGRRQMQLLGVAGALSLVPWFGKPTFALFTLAQIVALLADDDLVVSRRRALLAFAAGGAAGALPMLAFLVARGDALAFARVQLSDVPALYRFLWPRAPADIFSNPWCATQAVYALSGAVVVLALVALGEMPARALVLALVPVAALVSVVAQAKGFPYHFHPVTAGVHLQWLALVAWLTERARVAQRRLAAARLAPIAAGLALSFHVATAMGDSPHVRAVWMLSAARTPESRATPEYFAHFKETDFFPYEMRQAAAYLQEHTTPEDRVQVYGMDPYILFLAQRLGATPYIYGYDLDVDAALAGGTGEVPDAAQSERIRGIGAAHESDLVARLQASPPAAFVFLDQSPLLAEYDAWEDFADHCPRAAPWVQAHYRESARFGHDHVWLRSDVAPEAQRPDSTQPDEAATPRQRDGEDEATSPSEP
jgi:hypothetical protein